MPLIKINLDKRFFLLDIINNILLSAKTAEDHITERAVCLEAQMLTKSQYFSVNLTCIDYSRLAPKLCRVAMSKARVR